MAITTPSTAVSAPGKVLLAGGYLVLDRAYTGLVFGLSARIHVVVESGSGGAAKEVVVKSPQFRDAVWTYVYEEVEAVGGVKVVQVQGNTEAPLSRNPFVETALAYALTYINSVVPSAVKPVNITILADREYYSNPATSATSSTSFADFGVRLSDAHKTGLGSSAALVTSFIGSILSHLLPADSFSLATPDGRAVLHNLSQAAHCAAQGKVGSGFDIAAAVHGTCTYRRFSPSILSSVGEAGNPSFASRLKSCVEDKATGQKWDTEVVKGSVSIPKGMALIMCDVDCGSQTVGMVKTVLSWKAKDVEGSTALWAELQRGNDKLAAQFQTSKPDEEQIRDRFESIRELIRSMGTKAGVEIEPPAQTVLLNALSGLEGVIGGVVPGAGGYDAVALLVRDDEETMTRIKDFLVRWSMEKAENVKVLGVKGEMEGVRLESIQRYRDWLGQ